jgi:hypothetical protein
VVPRSYVCTAAKVRRIHMDAILFGLATLMLVVTPVLLILTVTER